MKNSKIFGAMLFCVAIISFASCNESKSNEEKSSESSKNSVILENTEELVELVWNFSQEHPDGFTLNIRTLEEPTEGIAVSYLETKDSLNKESLPFIIEHALEHDGYVGGWLNPDDGIYYFDSTKLFPENQMEEAVKFGKENIQSAIFVLSTGENITLNYEE